MGCCSIPRVILLPVCLMFLSMPVYSGPIAKAVWLEFAFTDIAVPATGCDPADPNGGFCTPSFGTPTQFLDAPPWTFNLSIPGLLSVTDAFLSGDRFNVLDNGISLGTTSSFLPGVDCGDDPVPCIANPAISSAVFSLAPGPHSITITPTQVLGSGGSGFLRVDDVPEPGTWLLLGPSLVVIFGLMQRKHLSHR